MSDEQSESPKSKPTRLRDPAERSKARGQIIPTSADANQAAKQLRIKLTGMLDTAAILRANRRRATAIDRVDFEAAFDDVVNPFPRPKRLALIGDLCGIFGAGFVGYSINI